jgi:hypothetical protein
MNIVLLPECLVTKRWTKSAKDGIAIYNPSMNLSNEPTYVSKYTNVVEKCKRMAVAVVKCGKPQLMRSTLDLIDAQTKLLEKECSNGYVYNRTFFEETILNPSRVRTKGCGIATTSTQGRSREQRKNRGATTTNPRQQNLSQGRKPQACGVCSVEGHNRTSCPVLRQQIQDECVGDENDDDHEDYGNIGTVDTVSQCSITLFFYDNKYNYSH